MVFSSRIYDLLSINLSKISGNKFAGVYYINILLRRPHNGMVLKGMFLGERLKRFFPRRGVDNEEEKDNNEEEEVNEAEEVVVSKELH